MAADNSFFYAIWGDFREDATFIGADRKNADPAPALRLRRERASRGSDRRRRATDRSGGDRRADPLTDGLLLLRYLFGFRDDALIAGAPGDDCERCLADDIEEFIESNLPP